MRYQVLGDLAVWDDEGQPVAVVGPSRRALLAILLLHANEVVATERLIDELWGERSPPTAAKSLRVHIWRLRKALGGNGDGESPCSTGVRPHRERSMICATLPGWRDRFMFASTMPRRQR